jgi:hypothetical protein
MVVDIECFPPFGAADRSFARAELRAFVGRVLAVPPTLLPFGWDDWEVWQVRSSWSTGGEDTSARTSRSKPYAPERLGGR